jgi:hypothetical protein
MLNDKILVVLRGIDDDVQLVRLDSCDEIPLILKIRDQVEKVSEQVKQFTRIMLDTHVTREEADELVEKEAKRARDLERQLRRKDNEIHWLEDELDDFTSWFPRPPAIHPLPEESEESE